MSMDTIFSVRNQDLERLSPQEAVNFFRELLWAEGTALGIGKNLIEVPSAITVADGGVDGKVQDVQISGGQGIIRQGLTCYQIKTGDLSPTRESDIRSILFREGSDELRPRVKSCLEKNGTLVVVLFGWDNPDVTDDYCKDKFKRKLADIDRRYKDAKIEIWRQNTLIGFLKPFPSLALQLTGRTGLGFQTHRSWSRESEMRRPLKIGQTQEDRILSIQSELRKNGAPVHIHVWGEPGIGKTRLVLEATRAEDLQPLVVYCDSASRFRDSNLMYEILRDDNPFFAILVIDECDLDSRSYIWNKLQYHSPRIKLVSIYSEYDRTAGDITYLDAAPLQEEQISSIIQEYGIPKDKADRWADLCSGSPRVAHVIGWNLKNHPEDLLRAPATVDVWNRYIVAGDDPDSQQVRQRRLVLQHIALFKRFGYGRPVVAEAQAIAKMVEQADPQITWPRFQEIIHDLKAKRILQGENTLYITPKALHIYLWTRWWNTYGDTFDLEDFSGGWRPKLLEWFYEMFKYAAESEVASGIGRELLDKRGPFRTGNYLRSSPGAQFFQALSEADPGSALECLKNTIGTWSKEDLLKFTTGRREVVWALEKIAMWRDLFADAARLLLALGEAENETWSNNASGVFAELFSLGPGRVAPTEASPQERFPVLKEAFESSSKDRRLLALRACDRALESQFFTRMIGAERQGLRQEPQLWTPQTYRELFDGYRRVWQLLCKRLDSLPEDEQQQAVNILLQRARGLARILNLTDMVIETVDELRGKPYVDGKKVLAKVVQILRYDGQEMPPEVRQRWEELRDDLTGSDFSSLMERYVAMDLLEDRFDQEGNYVDQTQPRIEELATQAIEKSDLLRPELDWLLTTEAQNGYRFGYELGKRDMDFSLLPILLEAQRRAGKSASVYFLGGYFRALFEKDQQKWEDQLDALTEDENLNGWVPELTWRSGISDQAALRILGLAEKGIIGIGQFRMLVLGGAIRDLSEDVFKNCIEFLLGDSDAHAASIALDLYRSHYLAKESKHTLPEELTLKLLTHTALFQKPEAGRRDQMDDYNWVEIGKAFVQLYPEKGLHLGERILEHFGEEGTIVEGFHSRTQAVLNEITRRYPKEVWALTTRYLGPPIDSRAFGIKEWLRGGQFFETGSEGALAMIPLERIWEWVDEDVENRAWYLASFAPKVLFREEGRICIAREVLARYGSREDVRRNLMANFSTEGWTGPRSLHYQGKKQRLLDFKKGEDNESVKGWIDEYVSSLDQQIERARIEEERRDF